MLYEENKELYEPLKMFVERYYSEQPCKPTIVDGLMRVEINSMRYLFSLEIYVKCTFTLNTDFFMTYEECRAALNYIWERQTFEKRVQLHLKQGTFNINLKANFYSLSNSVVVLPQSWKKKKEQLQKFATVDYPKCKYPFEVRRVVRLDIDLFQGVSSWLNVCVWDIRQAGVRTGDTKNKNTTSANSNQEEVRPVENIWVSLRNLRKLRCCIFVLVLCKLN